jgi:hypothetical protein
MQNYYLDDMAQAGGECKACPENTFSTSGSVGVASCLPRKPCTADDYTVYYSECNFDKNERQREFYWKVPNLCQIDHKDSVKLPAAETVKCRGCGRGEYRNPVDDTCIFCEAGYYQDLDNHFGDLKDKIRQCKVCPAGKYAPKKLDYGHFEKMPEELFSICAEVNDIGKPENCELATGWHVNKDGQLDSGVGVYQGQKLQLKAHV